ncbi:YczE/YyaS/YitT family protein [Microbacterium protaetiae]|uniref:membrane protein YczE n=1 Tax=Microbacterium protaetiae TaxID=2509458 RepID=UPI001A90E116|nr:hypothetical protein [Microbacterium protaetiae]
MQPIQSDSVAPATSRRRAWPALPAFEPKPLSRRPASRGRRLVQLLVGLFFYGIAIATMMQATIGIEPWDVFAQGIMLHTGIPFGLVTNLVGALVLLLWIPLRQRPGIGTVLNVLLIGPAAQFGLWVIPQPQALWARVLLFAAGLVLIAAATGLYIGAQHGPGPRDGLMTGLHARTGLPIWLVRTGIEATVLAVGWLLGGNVGWGTLAVALCIGPLVHVSIPLFALQLPEAVTEPGFGDAQAGRVIEPDAAARHRTPDPQPWALGRWR